MIPTPVPSSAERIAEIAQRLSRATPGPWVYDVDVRPREESAHYSIKSVEHQPEHPWSPRFIAWMTGGRGITPQRFAELERWEKDVLMSEGVREYSRAEADASFIACARSDMEWLLTELRAALARASEAERDTKRLDWLEDQIVDAAGRRFCLADEQTGGIVYIETYGSRELRQIVDREMSAASAPHPTEEPTNG